MCKRIKLILATHIFVSVLLMLLLGGICEGQSYLVRLYSEVDGLPSAYISDVNQDQSGKMWFATRGGIAAYDGYQWECFSQSNGLPVTSFMKIRIDGDNRIWALSSAGQGDMCIVLYDGKRWQKITSLPTQFDSENNITSFELMENEEENSLIPVLCIGTLNGGVLFWKGTKWTQFSIKNGLLSNVVNGLGIKEKKLIVATDEGISVIENGKVDNRTNEVLKHYLPEKKLTVMAISVQKADRFPDSGIKADRYWLLGKDWLGYFEENIFTLVFDNPGIPLPKEERFASLVVDYKGGVYISYRVKIFYYNILTGEWDIQGTKNGLMAEGASAIFIDFEKNIWIVGYRGVSKIISRRFSNYQKKDGLLEDEVTAIAEYAPGKIIFGHNSGITLYDGKSFQYRLFPGKIDPLFSRIMDVEVDSKKNIWIADSKKPLIETDINGNSRVYGLDKGLPASAMDILIDSNDKVWVGTSSGIYYLKNERFHPLDGRMMKKYGIRRIYKAGKDVLYFATISNGLVEFNQKTGSWKNYTDKIHQSGNNAYDVNRDKNGQILVGTLAGLSKIQGNDLVKFNENGFSINRPVYFITHDKEGWIWFGLDNGVIRWNGEKFYKYTPAEGLIGQETNRSANLVDSTGKLWIGTNRGVSRYNSNFDDPDEFIPKPKLKLIMLQAGNKKIQLPGVQELKLNHTQNDLTFYFQAISFINENRILYNWKLEGSRESMWREAGALFNRVIHYQDLSPGNYRLHLKIRNALGIWSDEVVSPGITIRNPFYYSWWFFLIVILFIAFIMIQLASRITQKKYMARLEQQVEERTKELWASEEKYSTLFRESKDIVYISSPDGNFVEINPAGVELFGYASREEILAADIGNHIYYNPRDREKFRDEISRTGYVKDYPLELKQKNGNRIYVLLTSNAEYNENGKVVYYRGIMRDITEKKKLEEQLERIQKMEAIGALAGGVAHDLNNILSGLTSYPELLLLQIPEDHPLRKPLTTIKRTGEKAAAVVQDLLTLSRRGVAVNEIINLNDIVTDYISSPEFKRLCSYFPGTCNRICLDSELLNVMGSPIHIAKTVMNLVSNAVEAMSGGGKLSILTENIYFSKPVKGYDEIPSGTYVRLKIIDEGMGISPEDLPKIFEPFYTRKKMGRSGTGLGLSVVWATMKDHNGFIDVKTSMGKGTSFELYFPVTWKEILKKESIIPLDAYKGKESILVIDDVEEQREVAVNILSNLGYNASAVASGEEAIVYLKKNTVDLLIIDMILEKGIDGLETYRRIIQEHPLQKAIIVSGYSETGEVKALLELGAGTYLKKPYTIQQLGKSVRSELDAPKEG